MSRIAVVVVLGVILAAAGGCGGGDAPRSPLAGPGTAYYVDPDGPAARQERIWRQAGRSGDADAMRVIAAQPVALWLTGDQGDVRVRVAEQTRRAAAAGQASLFVAYNLPQRDCGRYSSGGAPGARAYRRWIRELAAGLGRARATVILEPDAVPHLIEGCVRGADAARRTRLLRDAVRVLGARRRVRVYLDAGNPGWIDSRRLAGPLRRAGIARADGFALNVANFATTRSSLAYGRAVSRAVGGAHFVVDTSRNGNGPLSADVPERWCNPPGRALGTAPTTRTGDPRADAFLWIKQPGQSDGECGRGEPPAGTWWPEYALGLVRAARR